jgi:acid phosphatase
VLILEDHSYSELFGPPPAGALQTWPVMVPGMQTWDPNLRDLEGDSASFTNAHSVGHTNIVDYQAIFSGLHPNFKGPIAPDAPNIASELTGAGLSFGGYAEGLPCVGYTGGNVGEYSTTHNPWLPFTNFPKGDSRPFGKFPDDSWASLPTVSYVIPNQVHNMHSGTVNEADLWYQSNIQPYANWAMKHNSLLIVTWDESHQASDQIPTLFYGPMVKGGHYRQPITQENVLRTVEDMYGLTPTGDAAQATPITQIFKTGEAQTKVKHVAKVKAWYSAGDAELLKAHGPFSTTRVCNTCFDLRKRIHPGSLVDPG